MFIHSCYDNFKIINCKVWIRHKSHLKPYLFQYWFLAFPDLHRLIVSILCTNCYKLINVPCIFISSLFSYCAIYYIAVPMKSMKLASCVDLRFITINQEICYFYLCDLKHKPLVCVLHVHTFCDECAYLFLQHCLNAV